MEPDSVTRSQRIKLRKYFFSLISKDISHRKPHVLALRRMKQKLLTLPLRVVEPVSALTIAHKGAFHVNRRGPLHEFAPLCGAEVPHGLHVLVLGQVLG